jgi:hypothetical protein
MAHILVHATHGPEYPTRSALGSWSAKLRSKKAVRDSPTSCTPNAGSEWAFKTRRC